MLIKNLKDKILQLRKNQILKLTKLLILIKNLKNRIS